MIKYRGNLKDQLLDYKYWLKDWGQVLKLGLLTNVRLIPALLKYPWIYDHLKAIGFFKSQTIGRNGVHLAVMHELYYGLMQYIVGLLVNLINHEEELILHDEMIPSEIFRAMGVRHFPVDYMGFMLPCLDQHASERYIDATENLGVPADVCSLPSEQTGFFLLNEVPHKAACYVSSNLPCDGGSVAGNTKRRVLWGTPLYQFDVPDLYKEPWAEDVLVENLKEMIKFLEKSTGKTMDYDRLKEICERYNRVTEVDLEKWEYARTDTPMVTGATLWLPRLFHYQVGPGDKYLHDSNVKVSGIMKKAYKKGDKAWNNTRYRAIMWNCPPQFYTQVLEWMERAWGVSTLMDLETNTSVEMIDTTSPATMLHGLARKYMRSTMYKHTHGGYANNLFEMFKVAEEYRADFIFMANQISCRAMTSLTGAFQEEANKREVKICWANHDLVDARTVSRKEIRESINNFMFNVMKATPLDESLLYFDDGDIW